MEYRPVNKRQDALIKKVQESGIETDLTKRWEEGWLHNPKAEHYANAIGDIDWLFCGDSFCFKFGDDGDNGETLTYILDILFDMEDAEAAKQYDNSVTVADLVESMSETIQARAEGLLNDDGVDIAATAVLAHDLLQELSETILERLIQLQVEKRLQNATSTQTEDDR